MWNGKAKLRVIGARCMGVSALVALLAGCGDSSVADRLGLRKAAPDEFQVVRRAPLALPPDYSLRPPNGAAQVEVASTSEQAREALLGRSASARPSAASAGESALVAAAGQQAEPGIRDRITEENDELVSLDEDRFLFVLNWQRPETDMELDPAAEARRLLDEGLPTAAPPSAVRTESVSLPIAGAAP